MHLFFVYITQLACHLHIKPIARHFIEAREITAARVVVSNLMAQCKLSYVATNLPFVRRTPVRDEILQGFRRIT